MLLAASYVSNSYGSHSSTPAAVMAQSLTARRAAAAMRPCAAGVLTQALCVNSMCTALCHAIGASCSRCSASSARCLACISAPVARSIS
eukprot:8984764-Pyramimonas_sp.AAC.2